MHHLNNPLASKESELSEAGVFALSKDFSELKRHVNDLRQDNKNIIVGVLVALVLIVVTVAVEVIFFHAR